MGFFKRLFGLEKEETEQVQETQPVVVEQPKDIQRVVEKVYPICSFCNENCEDDRAIVHELGKVFHKKCARKLRKQAKNFIAGNQ